MSWRYGITVTKLPHGKDYYEIREFYQLEDGSDAYGSWTQDPISASGDSRAEVIDCLEMMLADAKKYRTKRIPYEPTNSKVEEPKNG